MDWNEHASLWERAMVRILDIRYVSLGKRGTPVSYRLPASGFMYVESGHALIQLESGRYEVKQHDLLHGGKGTGLTIQPHEDLFSYYLILYKASMTGSTLPNMMRLYEKSKPFDVQYVCPLSQTVLLREQLADMLRHWDQELPLHKLRVKATFYQFIYELMRVLTERRIAGENPDLVQMIIRYLKEHYRKQVTVDELAAMFNCSPTHLSRLFKRKTGSSPIHYLIQIRMEHAKQWLLGSNAGLKQIADKIGYPDGFYFSRMFKRHTGYSPMQFRNQFTAGSRPGVVSDSPLNRVGCDMEQRIPSLYTDNDNYYQYIRGENQMRRLYVKPSSIAMTMLLSFALLLGACQPAANNRNTGAAPTASPAAVQETAAIDQEAKAGAMRMYKHIDGETEIPVEPKRVFTDLKVGQLLTLDVKPIGSSTYPLSTGFIPADGIEDVGIYPLNLEKLTALEPDLIILTEAWRDGGGYEAFSKIAPTIVIPNHAEDLAEELRMFGDILGKKEEAERWLAEFEARVAAAKEQVNAVVGPEETFSILNVRTDSFYIYDDTNMGGNVLYKYLGLTPQPKVLTDVIDGEVWEISAEAVPVYIGDHLFLATNKGAEETLKNNEKIWANTAAIQRGKVYEIDFDQFLLTDPISVSHQLDIVTELIIANNRK